MTNSGMNSKINVSILGSGYYVPEKVLTNSDLEKLVETTDEWITSRTGIKERRVVEKGQAASDLAFEASRKAIDDAGITSKDLDLIIVATISPDMYFPSTACLLQTKLNAACGAFDLGAACSGYPYALTIATHLIESGAYKHILVVATEAISTFIDWEDRSTCVLFGDGAGATVVGPSKDGAKILSTYLGAAGEHADLLKIPAGGSRLPITKETLAKKENTLKMAGSDIFKLAIKYMSEAALKAIELAGLTRDDIQLFIPHQANLRIIDALAKKLKLPKDKIYVNLHRYGNMSAASTVVAMIEAVQEKKIKKGDKILLVAFGAGLTWSSCVIEW